jgi:hypothetical protein
MLAQSKESTVQVFCALESQTPTLHSKPETLNQVFWALYVDVEAPSVPLFCFFFL